MPQHCHILVKQTAMEMATAVFEEAAKLHNGWYKKWCTSFPHLSGDALVEEFARRKWSLFVEQARATLAQMLGTNIDEHLKEEIYSALMLDNSLKRKRWPR